MSTNPLSLWSRRLKHVTGVAIVALPAAVLLALTFGGGPAVLAGQSGFAVSAEATPLQIAAALAVGAVPLLILLWTLLQMRRLFAGLAEGAVFTCATARHIRRTGQGFLALALSPVLTGPAQSVLLSWANPPGQRQLALTLGSDMLGYALVSGLLIVIGWAMAQAAEIEAENRAFV